MLQERPDIARMQIMEMQKNTPVEGLTVYRRQRRGGLHGHRHPDAGDEGSRAARGRDGEHQEDGAPGGAAHDGAALPAGRGRHADPGGHRHASMGRRSSPWHQPIANQERCQGCHGTDHKVRAVVRVATSMEPVLAAVRTQRNRQMLVALLTIVAAAGVLGLAMRKVVVRPIQDLATVAHRIGEGDFQARARTNSGDELARLGSAFNDMTDRLSTAQERSGIPQHASWPPRSTSCRPRGNGWKCWSSSRASSPSSCPTRSRSCWSATPRPPSWRSARRKCPCSSWTLPATRACPSRWRPRGSTSSCRPTSPPSSRSSASTRAT